MLPVEPIARKSLAGGAFTLCDFVFVMRKREINPPRVNVQRFAEIFHGHGGAFDMPTGTAGADSCLPEVLTRLRGLPESKIARTFLFVAVVVHPSADLNAC